MYAQQLRINTKQERIGLLNSVLKMVEVTIEMNITQAQNENHEGINNVEINDYKLMLETLRTEAHFFNKKYNNQ